MHNHYSHYVEHLPRVLQNGFTQEPTEHIGLSTFVPTVVQTLSTFRPTVEVKHIYSYSIYSSEIISIIVGVSFATSAFTTICLLFSGAFGSRILRGACKSDISSVESSNIEFGTSVHLEIDELEIDELEIDESQPTITNMADQQIIDEENWA